VHRCRTVRDSAPGRLPETWRKSPCQTLASETSETVWRLAADVQRGRAVAERHQQHVQWPFGVVMQRDEAWPIELGISGRPPLALLKHCHGGACTHGSPLASGRLMRHSAASARQASPSRRSGGPKRAGRSAAARTRGLQTRRLRQVRRRSAQRRPGCSSPLPGSRLRRLHRACCRRRSGWCRDHRRSRRRLALQPPVPRHRPARRRRQPAAPRRGTPRRLQLRVGPEHLGRSLVDNEWSTRATPSA